MQAADHIGENDSIVNQVLIVSEILRILAISGPGAKADSRLDALTREAADLRALVDSGAATEHLREQGLGGVTLAEASVRIQTQEALRSGAKRSWWSGVASLLARFSPRRPRARAVSDPDENTLLRARSSSLLATLEGLRQDLSLEGLRQDLAPSYPPAPEVQPTPQVAGVSSPRHPQP
ncbi:MAG TPA: hypothetical protein VJN88_16200 [Ktedonobacterales bacterium]|nr:hypothetical protein [Ktedonobacterales bacterium]